MYRFLTIATAFLATSIVGVAHAGCEKDTDCKGDRICEAGACINPSTSTSADESKETASETEPPAQTSEAAEKAQPAAQTSEAVSEEALPSSDTKEEEGPVPTDPKDWWKETAREAEVPVLQAIFDEMPRPIRKKGNAKLVYQRAVPVVISDVHTTTTRWGGKAQIGVRFLGISKVHTTTTLDPITAETAGIPYCPVNCARITNITMQGDLLSLLYDGPIKEWAGNIGDNAAGYIRQVGKQYKASCSVPVLYNHAPRNSWLDPDAVQAVKDNAVAELKRYCGLE